MSVRATLIFLILLVACERAGCADINYMKTSIRNYFSNTRHHDVQFRDYKKAAKEYIFDEFVRHGLKTYYHTFNEPSVSKVTLFQNVIGVLRGERFGTPQDKVIGLGAHYDTTDTTKGVDDNGAGVVAMLEVVKQLTKRNSNGVTRKNTMIFAAFDLEENGYNCQWCPLPGLPLAGSRHFLEEWLPRYLTINYYNGLPTVQGVIIMDTMMEFNTSRGSQNIPDELKPWFAQFFPNAYRNMAADGFKGDFLNLIYRRPTNDTNVAIAFNTSWKEAGRPQFQLELFPLPFDPFYNSSTLAAMGNFLRSDHGNFWWKEIPAIWLTDSADFRGDMIQCYHQMCDNLEVMLTDENINFLGKTADVITDTMHGLSEPSGSGILQEEEIKSTSAGVIIGIIIGVIALQIPIIIGVILWRKRLSKEGSLEHSRFDNSLYAQPATTKPVA